MGIEREVIQKITALDKRIEALNIQEWGAGATASYSLYGKFEIIIDGDDASPDTGLLYRFVVPYDLVVTDWSIISDTAGSIVVDLWKGTYASLPTVANTITGSDKPTLSAAIKATSTTLTGWTTSWTKNDVIDVNIDSVDTLLKATLYISYIATPSYPLNGKIEIIIDGGEDVPPAGMLYDFSVPYDLVINDWSLIADTAGSIVIDLWKGTYASLPTVANTITGSDKPTLSSAIKATSAALTGWTIDWNKDDIIHVNIDSATTATKFILYLACTAVGTAGTGDVVGPAGATNGHMALFNGTSGRLLKDGGDVPTGDMIGPVGAVAGNLAVFADTSGKNIMDGGAVPADGDVTGPVGAVAGNLAVFADTTGKEIEDGGAIPTGDVVGPAGAGADHIAVYNSTTGKLIKDGGSHITDLVPMTVLSDMVEPTGFIDQTTSTIGLTIVEGMPGPIWRAYVDVSPTSSTFKFYSAGTLFTTAAQTTILTAADGLYYIYFDTGGTIQNSVSPWDIASGNVPIAMVYWDYTNHVGILMDERHGIQMDGRTHEFLHETHGPSYATGLAGTFAANGSTINIGTGEWYDEDLEWINASAYTQCRVFWLLGTIWNWTAAQNAYYHSDSSVPQYNNSGALADVDTNKYSISWVFMTNMTTTPIAVIMGQAQYTTLALAEAAGVPILGSLPAAEMLLLYKVIWQRNGAVITWKRTDDYRRISGGPINNYTATDHGALSGLADNDHPQYILDPSSPEQGDILYWNGSAWVRLAHGNTTDYLKSGGNAADPSWNAVSGTGDVVGPAGAVTGNLAVFADTTGLLIEDGGAVPAGGGDVVGPAGAVTGNMAVFADTTGLVIEDGGAPGGGGDVAGPAGAVTGNMAIFADTTGKVIEDGGVPGGSVPPALNITLNTSFI